MNQPLICLAMIVKDEAHVIRRCLGSVRPFIDRWCVVDTGSSDNTHAEVRAALAGVPGSLHERPWRDFGHNRSECLALAQQELGTAPGYLFVIDADEALEIESAYRRPLLDAPAYDLEVAYAGLSYARTCLVDSALPWRYEGVLHEYLTCDRDVSPQRLAGLRVRVRSDGARSRNPRKFHDDAQVLLEALAREPGNARHAYYLAQSWRDAGELESALQAYDDRAEMPDWEEEGWHAAFQAAVMAELLERPFADVLARYLGAFDRRPSRAEPLVRLAAWLRAQRRYALALMVIRTALNIPWSADRLFVEPEAYGWRRDDEYSLALYYTGDKAAARSVIEILLGNPTLPDSERMRVRANLQFCLNGGA